LFNCEKILTVSLEGLESKTNWLAVNRQLWSNSDSDSDSDSDIRKCPVEAGSNTSTVVLRIVGGEEKESLESETVKCRESYGNRIQEWLRCWVPAAIVNDRPFLSSEGAPQIHKSGTLRQQ
jgi:hypothetical protein